MLMKTVKRISSFSLFLVLVLSGQLYGQSDIELRPFDAVSAIGKIQVTLIPGEQEHAELTVRGIPEDQVTIKVDRGTLKLKVLKSIFYKEDEVKIVVTYRTLREIKAQAGAHIFTQQVVESDKLTVKANSGANIDLQVTVNAIEGSAAEGGVLKVSGKTISQQASATTGGRYLAEQLTSERAYAKASAGGQVIVNASELLEASANTGGIVEYEGSPQETTVKTVLGGTVRKI